MSGNGYVKMYRSLMNKGYYHKSEYIHLWLHLIFKATYAQREFLFNGKIEKLQPGQFITSRCKLAADTGIQESKVERILNVFETEHQIEQVNKSKYRIISICKWDEYQNNEQQFEHEMNSWRTAGEQLVNTNNKEKKLKKERKLFSQDSIEYKLSSLLFSFILEKNNNHKKPDLNLWSSDIDKMIRIDKRSPDEIEAVIRWCQADLGNEKWAGWQSVILSTSKLREKFDTLITRMKTDKRQQRPHYQEYPQKPIEEQLS